MRNYLLFLRLSMSLAANAQELIIEWDNWTTLYNLPAKERVDKQKNSLDCDSFLTPNALFDPKKWKERDENGVRQATPPINPFYFDKNCVENYLGKADSVEIRENIEIHLYYLDACYDSQRCQGFCVAFFYTKPNKLLFYTQRGTFFKN